MTPRDDQRLLGVNPDMVAVTKLAFELFGERDGHKLMVVEGLRSKERQAELFAQGRTKPGKVVTWTLKSKHIDGEAVDCAPVKDGVIAWGRLDLFNQMGDCFEKAAKQLGISIRLGMDWDRDGKRREKGESDSPHVELT
jgi:peptidoglycan L-alanyl-D-glutamate endopeptidase CwlK